MRPTKELFEKIVAQVDADRDLRSLEQSWESKQSSPNNDLAFKAPDPEWAF